jgi:hypothetical protein
LIALAPASARRSNRAYSRPAQAFMKTYCLSSNGWDHRNSTRWLMPIVVPTQPAPDKDAPLHRPVQAIGRIASVIWVGGLHHRYVRIA